MAATAKNIRSQLRRNSRRRLKSSKLPRKYKPKKNFVLARKFMKNWTLSE